MNNEDLKEVLRRRGALHVIDGHRFYTEVSVLAAMSEVTSENPWVSAETPPEDSVNKKSLNVLAATKLPARIGKEFEYHLLGEYVYFYNWKWFWASDGTEVENEVTHWKKLPEPPKK